MRSISLLALAVAGCASVEPRAGFPAVEDSVSLRSGYQVQWSSGSAEDAQVAARVDEMLAKPLDVDVAAQIALLNNRHLQAEYESLGVAQADLVAAGLLRNPVFDASVRFVEGGGSPTIDLGVAFDFLDVFFVGLRKRVAAAEFEVVRTQLTARVLATAGETKAAYYALQAARQRVELSGQIEQASAASADLAARLRAAGNIRPLDLAQEQAMHEEARIDAEAAASEEVVARERLARLVGVADAKRLRLKGRLPDPPAQEIALDGVESAAVKNSLALKSARQQITVELARLGITQPLRWGEVDIGASAERDDGAWSVGPSLSLPIPLFQQGQPAIARAESAVRAARERYRAMQIDVASGARSSAERVRSLGERVDRYRSAVLPLRAAITQDTQLQYNAMQVGAFQLLQAKRDEIAAGQTYVSLLRDYWIARAALELGTHGAAIDESSDPSAGQSAKTPRMGLSNSGGH